MPLLVIFLLVASCTRTPPADPIKPLQGTWVVLDTSGKPTAKEVIIEGDRFSTLTIKTAGDNTTTEIGGAQEEAAVIQVSQALPEIDFVYLEGAHLGKSKLGIFVFEEGTLKICTGEIGGTRPTEFSSATPTTLMVMKRKQ